MLSLQDRATYAQMCKKSTVRRALLLFLWGFCVSAAAQPALTPGDPRDGYERADYTTRSAALDLAMGQRLDLAARAAAVPLGLPALDNIPGADEVDLGRRLFFDRRLSANATLSCGMCHVPEQGFAQQELKTPVGIEGRSVRRNAPSLYNVAYQRHLFADGREDELEAQIWSPLLAENEMGNLSRDQVIERLSGLDDYRGAFARTYPQGLSEATLGRALAAYQRVLLSGNSPFDRWYFAGEQAALDETERRGFEMFSGDLGCASCHVIGERTTLFTNGEFYNTGIGYRAALSAAQPRQVQLAPGVFVTPTVALNIQPVMDDGRFEVTDVSADRWRYRVPSLRNIALTAPYMHDGSIASLAAVIDYYDAGGADDPDRDPRIRPLQLSAGDKSALLAFLVALTGSDVAALAADARSVNVGDVRRD